MTCTKQWFTVILGDTPSENCPRGNRLSTHLVPSVSKVLDLKTGQVGVAVDLYDMGDGRIYVRIPGYAGPKHYWLHEVAYEVHVEGLTQPMADPSEAAQ